MKIGIVVVAYNRPEETRRLVDSICKAEYGQDAVDLIVDVDKGKTQLEIRDRLQEIKWEHGDFTVILRPERMGLRPHVFACAEYTEKYDAVIVLEDDLVVAPSFYLFARQACARYDADERISQISLYSYAVNEFEARPFYPAKSDSDVFAMQVVQSWGECWTRSMWERFKRSEFYGKAILENNPHAHARVNAWGKNSWKKVFFNYLIETDTWVIYPYCSFVTNYSEAGEHCKQVIPDYQVVMQDGVISTYRLCDLDACVRYDAFFERVLPHGIPDFADCCIDLYGSKQDYEGRKYLASIKALPYRVVREYGLIRKPQEDNLLGREQGTGIFVYDVTQPDKPPKADPRTEIRYDFAYLSWKKAFRHGFYGFVNSLRERFSR